MLFSIIIANEETDQRYFDGISSINTEMHHVAVLSLSKILKVNTEL